MPEEEGRPIDETKPTEGDGKETEQERKEREEREREEAAKGGDEEGVVPDAPADDKGDEDSGNEDESGRPVDDSSGADDGVDESPVDDSRNGDTPVDDNRGDTDSDSGDTGSGDAPVDDNTEGDAGSGDAPVDDNRGDTDSGSGDTDSGSGDSVVDDNSGDTGSGDAVVDDNRGDDDSGSGDVPVDDDSSNGDTGSGDTDSGSGDTGNNDAVIDDDRTDEDSGSGDTGSGDTDSGNGDAIVDDDREDDDNNGGDTDSGNGDTDSGNGDTVVDDDREDDDSGNEDDFDQIDEGSGDTGDLPIDDNRGGGDSGDTDSEDTDSEDTDSDSDTIDEGIDPDNSDSGSGGSGSGDSDSGSGSGSGDSDSGDSAPSGSNIVRVRSPYFIRTAEETNSDLSYFAISINIKEGQNNSSGACDNLNTAIELNKKPIGNETSVTYDFTEIAKNYLEQNYQSNLTTAAHYQSAWVVINTSARRADGSMINTISQATYLIQEGYTLFEEGVNYTPNKQALITANCLEYAAGQNIVIPVNVEQVSTVKFYKNSLLLNTFSFSDNGSSQNKIKYISQPQDDDFNRVTFYKEGSGTTEIKLKKIEECKYSVNKIVFVNRWGAFEEVFFFKKSTESLTSTKEEFNASIFKARSVVLSEPESGSDCEETVTYNQYSTKAHSRKSYNANADRSITLNSGFVSECRNPSYEELMVSEYVWLVDESQTIFPVNLTESSFTKKTKLNDKMINYTMSFNISAKLVNNIR